VAIAEPLHQLLIAGGDRLGLIHPVIHGRNSHSGPSMLKRFKGCIIAVDYGI
jgi:hypothetical protein